MQCRGKRVGCFCVMMYGFFRSAVRRELGGLCGNFFFFVCVCVCVCVCVVPREESWVFLCDNVFFAQCHGKRAGCFCMIMYACCTVPWKES